MTEATRPVDVEVLSDGTQRAFADSTPSHDRIAIEVPVLPRKVIPVVFLPGIMGSHLRLSPARQAELKKKSDIAWRPEASAETLAMINKAPAYRQMILDPEATEVDRYEPATRADADERHDNVRKVVFLSSRDSNLLFNTGDAASSPADASATDAGRRRDRFARMRGWSEVYFSTYGKLLTTLDSQLNRMCTRGKPGPLWTAGSHSAIGVAPSTWGGDSGAPLAADALARISDAWYPVHAMGYNWLRSNGESAKEVAARIRALIADYNQAGMHCEKVIVVTHSMGGLVGRALLHADYGNAADVIAGIVHGAMPATGAAAAYKRMRAGFEGGGVTGYLFKKVVGATGPEVTAVLANAPGGLQLLPSERYGMGWLKAKVNGEEITLGPTSDPYDEIYANEDKWYRLINREWVNPAHQRDATWERTTNVLLNSRDFHRDIASSYKAGMTYVSFCADEKQKTWGDVVWEAGRAPFFHGGASQQLGLERLHIARDAQHWVANRDDGTGTVILHDGMSTQPFGVHIAAPSEAGDGTVPLRSGEDPVKQGKATVSFKQNGYEHQGSFENQAVISSTLYAIASIAESFTWWEQ